jgi:hypothetical protein
MTGFVLVLTRFHEHRSCSHNTMQEKALMADPILGFDIRGEGVKSPCNSLI